MSDRNLAAFARQCDGAQLGFDACTLASNGSASVRSNGRPQRGRCAAVVNDLDLLLVVLGGLQGLGCRFVHDIRSLE